VSLNNNAHNFNAYKSYSRDLAKSGKKIQLEDVLCIINLNLWKTTDAST